MAAASQTICSRVFSMQGSRVMEWEVENVRSKEKITAQLYVDENNFKERKDDAGVRGKLLERCS